MLSEPRGDLVDLPINDDLGHSMFALPTILMPRESHTIHRIVWLGFSARLNTADG
jgi:hypothetical protein